MRIFLDHLHIIFFPVIPLYVPDSMMVCTDSACIGQARIEINRIPVKAGRNHLIHPIRQINNVDIYVIHLD